MIVFVDVDGTLVDGRDIPRPYIYEFFSKLKELGCHVIVWSAGGQQYAENKISMIERKINMEVGMFIDGYLWKLDYWDQQFDDKQFFIDDSSGIINRAERSGHKGFLILFYDSRGKKEYLIEDKNEWRDEWLLRAFEEVKKYNDILKVSV